MRYIGILSTSFNFLISESVTCSKNLTEVVYIIVLCMMIKWSRLLSSYSVPKVSCREGWVSHGPSKKAGLLPEKSYNNRFVQVHSLCSSIFLFHVRAFSPTKLEASLGRWLYLLIFSSPVAPGLWYYWICWWCSCKKKKKKKNNFLLQQFSIWAKLLSPRLRK